MVNEVNKWLTDIEQAIIEINSFLPKKRDFTQFKKDLKTRRAVERNIEIIGEAINRLLQKQPDIAITYARKIVDTRNYIIHGYDSVSYEIVWAIIVKDLPLLEKEIDALLKSDN
jgi:uncharacterized protein with HEPN domain